MVFFAFRVIPSSSSTIAFLRYLAKAAVVACGVSFVKSIIDAVHRPEMAEEKMNDVSRSTWGNGGMEGLTGALYILWMYG